MEHFALTPFITNVQHRTIDRQAGSQASTSRLGWMLYFCLALAIGSWMAPQAKADFITQYPLSDFILTNSTADGFVTMSGSSIVLTGGNSGVLESGTTDLVTIATKAGLIQFDWSYFSYDLPTFDFAGYLLNGAFVQLADTSGESEFAQFSVSLGETFGFRVGTKDNQGEPGILTVSSADSVPEPRTWPILVMGITGILSRRLWLFFRASAMKGGA
jgi:hypothetical protein